MSEVISIRFNNNEKEYGEVIRIHLLKSLRTKIDIIIAIILILSGFIFLNYYGYSAIWALMIGAGTLFLFIMLYALYILPPKRFRQEPKFKDEYILDFSEDGLIFKTEQLNSKLDWSYYNKVWESDKFYLLFYGKGLYTFIPKRAFVSEAQQDQFRKLLNTKIVSGMVRI